MGTLTSIIEQLWSLFQGNIIFLFDSVMGIARLVTANSVVRGGYRIFEGGGGAEFSK